MAEVVDRGFLSGLTNLFSSSGKKEKDPLLPSADVQSVMQAVMSGLQPGTMEFYQALNASASQNDIIPSAHLGPFGGLRDRFSSDAQSLIKKQANLSAIGTHMQTVLADTMAKQTAQQQIAPPFADMQQQYPSLRPTQGQMRDVSQPLDVSGYPAAPNIVPGNVIEGPPQLVPTNAPTSASSNDQFAFRYPTAPRMELDPSARATMPQQQQYQALLAGHQVDPRASLVPPALQASRETPVEVNPGNTLMSKQGATLATAPGKADKDNEELKKFRGVLEAAGIAEDSPEGVTLFKSWASKIATPAPGTSVTTNVNTEKKYGEVFSTKVAEQDTTLMDAAQKAPDLAERSNRILQVLEAGKVMTGTGAEWRLQTAKAFKLAGLSAGDGIEETETLSADLASSTLDAIKASGLGGGTGFSNADREFLEKAKGGKITLEAGSLKRLAELSHRAAEKSTERWNARAKKIPKSAIEGTGLNVSPLSVPPRYGSPAAVGVAPFENADKERRYQQFKKSHK